MARSSTKTRTSEVQPLRFKSEAEEADWLASPAGRRFTSQQMDRAVREGRAKVVTGSQAKRSDPDRIRELMDRVKAKQTQAISLRIAVADLDAAKKIADKAGIGYQTVLKDLIHEGLRRP
jgi:hypothetical protein